MTTGRTWEAITEVLDRSCLLLLSNFFVFLLVGSGLQPLPWESTSQEVHEDVAKSLKIIATGLLTSKMGVDTHVTGGSRQRLAFSVRNVLLRLGVTVLLGHTEVNNVDHVGTLGAGPANQKIVRLDVAVD